MESLPYDAHTHTSFSDGRNSPEENVRAAEACGLRCIALTDHVLPETSRETVRAQAAVAGTLDATSPIKVIAGLEGVILDTEGTVSVEPEDAARVSLVLVDLGMRTRGIGLDPPASVKRYHDNVLAAIANAAQNPVVDAIAHPFNLGRFGAVINPEQLSREGLRRVARILYDRNVAFEIMNQAYWWYPQLGIDEFTRDYCGVLRLFAREGVKFVVGSDAHSAGAVGNLRYCLRLMRGADIELSQLVDLERMAATRSARDT